MDEGMVLSNKVCQAENANTTLCISDRGSVSKHFPDILESPSFTVLLCLQHLL